MQSFQEELTKLYETIEFSVQTQTKLNDIFLEMQEIEKHALERGFIRDDDVNRMIDLNVQHYLSTYEQGRKMIQTLPIKEKIKAHITGLKGQMGGENEKLRKSLYTYLDALTTKPNVNQLMKSNASFEKDEYKNPIVISEGPEGLKQMENSLRKEIDYIFETNIVKDFRNLV